MQEPARCDVEPRAGAGCSLEGAPGRCLLALIVLAALLAPGRIAPEALEPLLEPIRAARDVPALAAAVARDGRIVAVGATGLRALGHDVRVTREDRFHIGSCTKAMTATLAAVLVERGRIRWDTTVAEGLPHLPEAMHAGWSTATLEMLLQNRGGLPNATWPAGLDGLGVFMLSRDPQVQRRSFVGRHLAAAPAYEPGSRYVYSNAGYSVAGEMLAQAGGASYESLLVREVLAPIGIRSAGFGPAGRLGDEPDQPWGHAERGGKRVALPPGPLADNPPAITPAGRVHLSIADWALFAAFHAGDGMAGGRRLLQESALRRLQAPPEGGEYAAGWVVTTRAWGGGTVLTHAGSNTYHYAVAWVAPARRFAVVAATNTAGPAAERACDEACAAAIGRFLREGAE
ncbi:MAG TPA: serine hydrolase domain-containing protein [Chthonomonadales bacterium]|nr:serine hydrolase domain-containing protein [Chthonomonadales bacterium]